MPVQTPSFAKLLFPDLKQVYFDEAAVDDTYDIRKKMQREMEVLHKAKLDAEAAKVFRDSRLIFAPKKLFAPQNPLDKPQHVKRAAAKASHGWALVGPVTCVRESVRAVCVRFDGSETWVPRSQLHATENEIKQQGDQGMLILPLWLAQEKGWIPA